jgi:hypothetical protein
MQVISTWIGTYGTLSSPPGSVFMRFEDIFVG